jgi:hypothetical protein
MYAACKDGAEVIEVQNAVLKQWEAERADKGSFKLDLPVAGGEEDEEGEEGEGGDCAEREIEGCSSDDDVQGGAAAAGSADGAQ